MYGTMNAKKDQHQFWFILKDRDHPEMVLQYTGGWELPEERKFFVVLFPNNNRLQRLRVQNYRKNRYQLFQHESIIISRKNFILIHEMKKCVIFAKKSKTKYSLKISYPFSTVEGFALACAAINNSSFQN
jgi:hypothetical protein